jgi:amidase
MARNVADLALLLSVIAGPSTRAPMSLETGGAAFGFAPTGLLDGVRVALSTDLGGAFQVDEQVAAIVRAQGDVLAGGGAVVVEDHLDVTGAETAFRTLRAWLFQHRFGALLERRPEAFKASLAENIRAGETLTGADVATAYQRLTSLAEKVRLFFEKHDVLVLPVSQVPPFDAAEEYPATINGQEQATYLDWMRSAYLITVTGCPAISVPAGFTREGWPVGVQIVAAPRNERLLLEVAHAFEQLTRVGDRRPDLTPEEETR